MVRLVQNAFIRLLRPRLAHSVGLKLFLYRLLWLLPERWRGQDKAVRAAFKSLAKSRSDVTFVSMGSNDGLSGDPLCEFIFTYKWHGVFVEPVDFVFGRLRKAFGGRPGISFENAAISNKTGKVPFWYVRQNSVLAPGYDQVGSFNRDHVVSKAVTDLIPGVESFVECRDVACITVHDLLVKHKISHVDVVFIDTEGYDFEVIKQIDFVRMKPSLIVYEESQLSDADKSLCRQHLTEVGYSVSCDGVTGIAVIDPLVTNP